MIRKNILLAISVLSMAFTPNVPVRIFLVGDSTMADKPLIDNPEHGSGQMLPIFFSKNVAVVNYARNGRSTKSFISEGRWDIVMNQLRSGDYVFIQFGHNDEKQNDTSRYAAPHTDYKTNLLKFIHDSRSKGAIPVLLTPVNRRQFNAEGNFVDTHGEYPGVVREVAAAENVPLLDVHASSADLFKTLGPDGTKKLFLVSVQPNIYSALPNGKEDNTHFTRLGAVTIDSLVIDALRHTDLTLASEIITPSMPLAGNGIVVGLDEYYNNEWKVLKDGKKVRYHYVWDDTLNSGFSELAKIFDRDGADTDTLLTAPTAEKLKKFGVYIIVDPDTPAETDSPNYIEEPAVTAIENWVKEGGVLVMMCNDKGNAEFTHFNMLAGRFGIHFNEDMYQDVIDHQYDSAKIAPLPDIDIFKNADHVYIKQLSSLSLTPPANELLHARGVTIMAESHIGKGLVFAVGDPWLYNEYITNRNVPKGYENYGAAESFALWLCKYARPTR